MNSNLHPYAEQLCLSLGTAGSGKSQILPEAHRILTQNEVFRLFQTARPSHKACKIANGITLHRLLNVSPSDYSYEHNKIEFKNDGIKYVFIDEISMIPEQMWNVIAHVKRQFGFICYGLGGFKQLKPVNEEHIDFRNIWVVKYVFGNNLCEVKHIHRFNESKLLQGAYNCANGENIEFNVALRKSTSYAYAGLIKLLIQ